LPGVSDQVRAAVGAATNTAIGEALDEDAEREA
jgi:hypothetical protein